MKKRGNNFQLLKKMEKSNKRKIDNSIGMI